MEWQKYELHLINENLTQLRIKKLKQMYNTWIRFTNKPLNTLTKDDIEKVITELNKGILKKRNGKDYGVETVCDLKKFIKQYFKYFKGENNYFPKEVIWINVKIPKDKKNSDKEVLTINQVKELSNMFKSPKHKLAVLLLFDSGFRIEEFMSVRKRDITIDVFNKKGDKCHFINCNESKTFPRNIPIPLFSEDIQNFVNNDDEFLIKQDNEFIFDFNYESFNKILKRNSLKLFNIKVTPHLFRHSSATYYTHEYKLTHHQLCDRYGWTYASNVPAKYIRRSGNGNLDQAQKVFSNDISKLKEENEELKNEVQELKGLINQVISSLPTMKKGHIKDLSEEERKKFPSEWVKKHS